MGNLPIDQGWAWMVALGCCGMFTLVIGCLKTEGVFFVEFIEKYQASKADTAWIAALTGTVMLSVAPFANALCDYFTTRKIVICGAIISAIGFVTSGYATQVWHLYITFGVLIGLGFGLSYAPSLVVLGQYFKKRRALANGLAGAGSGVGGFIVPVLVRWSIDEYGLRGSFIVMSGFILNLILVGALYRPLSFYYSRKSSEMKRRDEGLETNGDIESPVEIPPHETQNGECVLSRSVSYDTVMNGTKVHVSEIKLRHLSASTNDILAPEKKVPRKSSSANVLSEPLVTSMYSLSISNLARDPKDENANVDASDSEPSCKKKLCGCFLKSDGKKLRIFDWTLMKNSIFLILLVTACLGMGGYPVINLFLPAHMDDLNFSKQDAVLVLSISSILDFLGRISVGWVTDHIRIKRHVYAICLIICGMSTAVVILSHTFAAIIVGTCLFGFFGGAYMSLNAVVLAEEMGTEALSHSLGICVLVQSIAQLSINPIVGLIRDSSGSWNDAFLLTGLQCVVGGLVLFFIPCAKKYEDYRAAVLASKVVESVTVVECNTKVHVDN